MRLEAIVPRPNKCQLDITEVVTHPLGDKAEPCLNQAIGRQNALVQLHDTIFWLNRLISNPVRLQNS